MTSRQSLVTKGCKCKAQGGPGGAGDSHMEGDRHGRGQSILWPLRETILKHWQIYMSGFMKTVLKNLNPITRISPCKLISLLLKATFKPRKRRKIEKGRQWKEDKRVEKETKDWISFYFYIVTFGEKNRPLKTGIQFIFKNPDINIFIFLRVQP